MPSLEAGFDGSWKVALACSRSALYQILADVNGDVNQGRGEVYLHFQSPTCGSHCHVAAVLRAGPIESGSSAEETAMKASDELVASLDAGVCVDRWCPSPSEHAPNSR